METLFEDDYINSVVLKRLIKEVKKKQIKRTIKNIDYFDKIRQKLNNKYDFSPAQNERLERLRYQDNLRRNLQA